MLIFMFVLSVEKKKEKLIVGNMRDVFFRNSKTTLSHVRSLTRKIYIHLFC